MSKQKKYHYIYKTTCKITGKFYIGMHSTDNLEDGYLGSGKILGYSRKKYGDENHIREILEMSPSREALKAREKEIVNEELLADPLSINLKYGGDGGYTHKPTFQFHSAGGKVSGLKTQNLLQGSRDVRWKAAMEKMVSARNSAGGFATFTGLKHTEKTKERMSVAHSGEKNSQFGSCWVVKNAKPIKIKKEQLEEYLKNGFLQGRKYVGV